MKDFIIEYIPRNSEDINNLIFKNKVKKKYL